MSTSISSQTISSAITFHASAINKSGSAYYTAVADPQGTGIVLNYI